MKLKLCFDYEDVWVYLIVEDTEVKIFASRKFYSDGIILPFFYFGDFCKYLSNQGFTIIDTHYEDIRKMRSGEK